MNEAASRAKAEPAPIEATSHPPRAGPINRNAIGRTSWSSAFACASSSSARICGTIASNAGPKNAVPAP